MTPKNKKSIYGALEELVPMITNLEAETSEGGQ